MAVLEELLAEARDEAVLTIADAKRGDIGSTMAAYADAWLRDSSPLAADSVTLSPYLGFESLRPGTGPCGRVRAGCVCPCADVQPGRALPSSMSEAAIRWPAGSPQAAAAENERYDGALGSVGLVVGATVGSALTDLQVDLAGSPWPRSCPRAWCAGGHPGGPEEDVRCSVPAGAGYIQPRYPRCRPRQARVSRTRPGGRSTGSADRSPGRSAGPLIRGAPEGRFQDKSNGGRRGWIR